MAEWSVNNRACTTLWFTLLNMDQLFTNFDDSGSLTMKDLTFFNPTSSSDARRIEATLISDQLDTTFIEGRGARYEDGIDREAAVASMIDILTDEGKTLEEFATSVDESYLFWEEPQL